MPDGRPEFYKEDIDGMKIRDSLHYAIIDNLVILTVISLSYPSFAQSQNQASVDNTKNEEQIIRCFQEYIAMVKVEVTGQDGKEVADLRKDDFIIYEDGVKQELIFWKRNAGSDRQADQAMYEAGYYPTKFRFRGEWRKIRVLVRVKDQRKLKVQFAPKGYYAKRELRK